MIDGVTGITVHLASPRRSPPRDHLPVRQSRTARQIWRCRRAPRPRGIQSRSDDDSDARALRRNSLRRRKRVTRRAASHPRTLGLASCHASSPPDCSSCLIVASAGLAPAEHSHSTFLFRYTPKKDRSQGDMGGSELHVLHCPAAIIEQSFAAMSLPATLWPVAFQWPKPIGVFLNPCRKI